MAGFASQADGTAPVGPSGGFASQAVAPDAAPTAPAPVGKTVNVIAPDGKVYGLDESFIPQAKAQGYQVESAEHAGIRKFVEDNPTLGAAGVVARKALNQLTFGASDVLIDKYNSDPYEQATWKALEAEHGAAAAIGNVGGFAGSLLYGGPLFKGAAKAGGVARAAFLGAEEAIGRQVAAEAAYRVGAEGAAVLAKHTPSIARQILAHAADYGVQGLAFAAPKAMAEAITGDPERAAETWLWGAVGGAALGGTFGLAKGAAGKLFSGAGGAVAEAAAQEAGAPSFREKVAGKVRDYADDQAVSGMNIIGKPAEQIAKLPGGKAQAAEVVRKYRLAPEIGDGAEAVRDRILAKADEVGTRIGKSMDEVSRLADRKGIFGKFDLRAAASSVEESVIKSADEIERYGSEKAIGDLQAEMAKLSNVGGGAVSLKDAWRLRTKIDKLARKHTKNFMDPNASEFGSMLLDARGIIDEQIEQRALSIAKEAGDAGWLERFNANQADYRVLKILGDSAQKNIGREIKNRGHSMTDYLGNIVGGIVGSAVGGPIGSAAGAYLGGEINNRLRRFGPAYIAKGAYAATDALEGRGMVALEQAFAAHDKQLSVIPTVLDRMASGGQSKPVRDTLGVNILTRFIEAHDAKLDDHKGVMGFADNLASLAANPDRMEQKINEAIAPLQSEAPEVAMAVGTKLGQVVGYLAQQAPKSPYAVPVPFTPQREWRPSEQQIKDYKTKIAVAKDPYVAIDALGDGTLTKAHVDALRALAPRLHEEMVRRITDYGASGRAPALPYAQRLKLSMMTGAPLDRSIAQLASLQATYQPSEQSGGGSKKMNLPAAQASDLSRITG